MIGWKTKKEAEEFREKERFGSHVPIVQIKEDKSYALYIHPPYDLPDGKAIVVLPKGKMLTLEQLKDEGCSLTERPND